MVRGVRLWGAALLLLMAMLCGAAPGRADPAELGGTVTGKTGQTLAGATVELRDAGNRLVARAVTDEAGRFRLPSVAPGRYVMVVSSPGFTAARATVVAPAERPRRTRRGLFEGDRRPRRH